jgi:hypothetical protein
MTPEAQDRQDQSETGRQSDTPANAPSYVRDLGRGVTDSADPITLGEVAVREIADKVREIEEARAAAAVSGRDYLIR